MAFCSKCGTYLGNGNFCPKCGARVCIKVEKVNKIISTQYNITLRMIFTVIFGIFMLFLGLTLILQGEEIVRYYDFDISDELAEILGIMFGIFLIYTSITPIPILLRQGKSYLNVYDDRIEGVAISGIPNVWLPTSLKLENVTLQYSDIQNCTTSKIKAQKKIIIYTPYGNYEFLGGNNLESVVNEINQRLTLKYK